MMGSSDFINPRPCNSAKLTAQWRAKVSDFEEILYFSREVDFQNFKICKVLQRDLLLLLFVKLCSI